MASRPCRVAPAIAVACGIFVSRLGGALLRPGAELNFRYAGHDQFHGDFYRSSGGSIVNVTPFLEIPLSHDAEASAPWLRFATRMPLGSGGLFGHQHEGFTYLVGVGTPF